MCKIRSRKLEIIIYDLQVCLSCLLSWLVYVHVDVSLVKIICVGIGWLFFIGLFGPSRSVLTSPATTIRPSQIAVR